MKYLSMDERFVSRVRVATLTWQRIAALLVLACATQSACSTRHCMGRQVFCNDNSTSNYCTQSEGCSWVPGCVNPIDYCPYRGYSQADCESYLGGCLWTGTKCESPCASITDQTACTHGCVWSNCTGVAKQCYEYSADNCPLDRDCYVEDESI